MFYHNVEKFHLLLLKVSNDNAGHIPIVLLAILIAFKGILPTYSVKNKGFLFFLLLLVLLLLVLLLYYYFYY